MGRQHDVETRSPRQKEFITAAARLFSARGYHAVGINEISAELGLSGPAIYNHYSSKQALLIAVLDDVITSHLEGTRDLVLSLADPRETLAAIIDHHLAFVFDQYENIVTWRTEFRNLPEADSHRLRYLQRLYTAEWARTVSRLRPELDNEVVRAMCDAAIALLQSPTEPCATDPRRQRPSHTALPRKELGPVLAKMAFDALLGAAPATLVASGPKVAAAG
ncbi:TetR/AcrR family transcriptional regulator [Mycolicibacterium septicum]|uniref:TetR/AcrR family transcriptional regulator n=1 Tax=Mycolicibacterium septicum TaxID=98668 RepID=UPI00235E76EB|nr:TetR/AcrR family transcriptional regulator [Mycolicibacterium septicum]